MDFVSLAREFGVPTGVAIGLLVYLVTATVPKKCYEDAIAERTRMTESIATLTERIGILLDREGVRTV